MQMGRANAAEPIPYAGVPNRLADRLRCGCQHSRQGLETGQQRSRPASAQPSVEAFQQRRQDGSAPMVRSRERCHAVAAARSSNIG